MTTSDQKPAPDAGRPAVITAVEFIEQGYAEKIKAGEYVVIDHMKRPIQYRFADAWGHYCFGITETSSWLYSSANVFDVRWLPVTPLPVTAGEGEADDEEATTWDYDFAQDHANMCGHLSDICEALGLHDQNGKQIVSAVRERVAQIASLQSELASAKALVANLRTSIEGTVRNAPKEEPVLLSPASLSQAWAFWYAARQLEFVLEVSSGQEQPNDNTGTA